jgi:hypothetical protein
MLVTRANWQRRQKEAPSCRALMRGTLLVALALVCSWCAFAGSAVGQGDDGKLEMIRAVSRNSFQAIRTLHAKYTTIAEQQPEKEGGKVVRTQVWNEWWQDGKQVRWSTERDVPLEATAKPGQDLKKRVQRTRQEGVLSADGDVKSLYKQGFGDGKWIRQGAITTHKRDQALGADIWIIALFVIRQQPRATLADLLEDTKHVKQMGFEIVDKHRCEKLLLRPPAVGARSRIEYEVVVDSRYNYLVRGLKPVNTSPEARLRREVTVRRFLECAPGLFFPAEIESRSYTLTAEKQKGKLLSKSTTRFTHVKANEHIDPRLFHLEFEAGTPIYDGRNQTMFTIGKDQKPVGPVEPVAPPRDMEAAPTYDEPPLRWWLFAAWGLPALLGLALGLWWLVRRRRRTVEAPAVSG